MSNAALHTLTGVNLYNVPLTTIDGQPTSLGEYAGRALLLVNVASKCGMTPQYAGLERLQKEYADRGLTVIGFPCNQFGGQEPGTNEEIAQFCATTYGVSFPMTDKVEVNGTGQHPIFAELNQVADSTGTAGEVNWNFEKWVIDAQGKPVARYRSRIEPTDPEVVRTIESVLPRGKN